MQNEALQRVYESVLRDTDDDERKHRPVETEADRQRQWLEDHQRTLARLNQIAEERALQQEITRARERAEAVEKKRNEAIRARERAAKQAADELAAVEEQTRRFWTRNPNTGELVETGAAFYGESLRAQNAWIPHGQGDYKVNGEVMYEGGFNHGRLSGDGRLLLPGGEMWHGPFHNDAMHGMGVLVTKDNVKKPAIFWNNQRVCLISELIHGVRVTFHGKEHHHCGSDAVVVSACARPGRYKVKFEASGVYKTLDLGQEHFTLQRHLPRAILPDCITSSEECMQPKLLLRAPPAANGVSDHTENLFFITNLAQRQEEERQKLAQEYMRAKKREELLAQREAKAKEAKKQKDDEETAKAMEEDKRLKQKQLQEEKELQAEIERAKADAMASGAARKIMLRVLSSGDG